MKAGYYINESNNLILVYPKGYNNIPYTLDVFSKGKWELVAYSPFLFNLLDHIIDFSYIGEL